ncbi:MAG TPA: outer membrane lipoprotein chaperone LolA [Vicinamibacterales bacterium]|nr:outer membrane lipoprotein chaperone LolA [Vicinamibacterales bacterium]
MTPLLLSVLLVLVPAVAPGQSRRPAAETARALQEKYDRVKDFTADFTHAYEGGVLNRKSTERGTVQIKKPGRMRWEYTAPEKKTFVSDGIKIFSYVPADKQVIVSDVPSADEATTAVLFLAGKGSLLRDFNVSYVETAAAGAVALRLDPRQKQRDYDWLIVTVDEATLQIRALTAADQQGGRSTFTFTNYRENTGIADNVFAFKIPRGADVIHAGTSR